jgi:LPXTG-motif cell wall-anchored protein
MNDNCPSPYTEDCVSHTQVVTTVGVQRDLPDTGAQSSSYIAGFGSIILIVGIMAAIAGRRRRQQ